MKAVQQFFSLCFISSVLVACTGNTNNKPVTTTPSGHEQHTIVTDDNDYAALVNNGTIAIDTLKGSPARTAMDNIGNTHVHITYNSPGVKGRVIWGGLVAYDQVWVTGAHHATNVKFYKSVLVGSQKVEAGTYAIFTIPGKEEWLFILNKHTDQHLADEYDTKDDVLRMKITPQVLSQPIERLTYEVIPAENNKGLIRISWDRLQLNIPVEAITEE